MKKIPSPSYFKKQFPLSQKLKTVKANYDQALITNLVDKKKFVIVVGPCAVDSIDAGTEYLLKLKSLADQTSDKFLIVARIFTAKPRTDGEGFLGLAFHNNASERTDFCTGIENCRKLMLKCLEIGLPVADELLYPELSSYFSDLVSYQFLGARSSLDPLHRAVASGLNVVVGVKNSIDGDLKAVVKSVKAVQTPKQYLKNCRQVETSGNKFAHIVLRGFHDGENFRKNCNSASISKATDILKELNVENPFVMVDCSHANSGKVASNQIENALEVVLSKDVDGIILESYLKSGVAENEYGVSKTDDCLDFESTKQLIFQCLKLKQT